MTDPPFRILLSFYDLSEKLSDVIVFSLTQKL